MRPPFPPQCTHLDHSLGDITQARFLPPHLPNTCLLAPRTPTPTPRSKVLQIHIVCMSKSAQGLLDVGVLDGDKCLCEKGVASVGEGPVGWG